MKKQVFLGGACGQTTWRRDIAIPALEAAGITWHNPQIGVGEWTAACEVADMKAKAEADVLLFVIGGTTRGVASVAEVGYLLGCRRPLALAVEDVPEGTVIDGRPVSAAERDDLNRGRLFVRTMAAQHGVPCFANLLAAVHQAITLAKQVRAQMTLEEVQNVLADVKFDGHEFLVEETPTGFHLHVRCPGVDVDSGAPCFHSGRKWHIPHDAIRSDVVRTAFKAVLTWLEHEARERFTYRKARVFGPHLDVELMARLCQGEG
jgi:hypothetical protein